jgi:hypothetical protein
MRHDNNFLNYHSSTPKSLIVSAYKIWAEMSKEYILRRRAAFNYLADLCERAGKSIDDAREAYDESLYGSRNNDYSTH